MKSKLKIGDSVIVTRLLENDLIMPMNGIIMKIAYKTDKTVFAYYVALNMKDLSDFLFSEYHPISLENPKNIYLNESNEI